MGRMLRFDSLFVRSCHVRETPARPFCVAALILALLICPMAGQGQATDLTPERITTLAKKYFRDSAELPMKVAVTTVVEDSSGKEKRRANSTVLFVFKGYNLEAGSFKLRGNSGWTNTWALRDSLTGHLAAYIAAGFLAPKKDEPSHIEIAGPFLITARREHCPAFELIGKVLYPKKTCGSVQFRLIDDANGGLTFDHFTLDIANLPATARITYLGNVEVSSFHVEEDFQKAYLPGDPQPFLLPKQVVTTVTTNKGTVTMTNLYNAKPRKY